MKHFCALLTIRINHKTALLHGIDQYQTSGFTLTSTFSEYSMQLYYNKQT